MLSKKRYVLTVIVFVIIFMIFLKFLEHANKNKKTFFESSFPVVEVAIAREQFWSEPIETLGVVKAAHGVDVSASVGGIVDQIYFNAGEKVNKGQVLLSLKNGDLKAQIEEDQSQYELAKKHYERSLKLYHSHAVSHDELDHDTAQVKQTQSELAKAEAQYDQKIITAPFDGTVGISQVNLGEYVSPGQKIVSLQDLSDVYVDFSLPQNQRDKVFIGSKVEIQSGIKNTDSFSANVIALEPQLNSDNHSLNIRAKVEGNSIQCVPGMFVKIKILGINKKYTVVPRTAIVYEFSGTGIYVIKNKKAYLKSIKVGNYFDNKAIVLNGISVGDQVVVSGQLKLWNGANILLN